MPATSVVAPVAFARKAAFGAFVAGACRATFVVGMVAASALLALRLAGSPPEPDWLWTLAVVPVVVAGLAAMRRARLSRAAAACHLDRRLQLDGLLLASHELGSGGEWAPQLEARMRDWRRALPTVPWATLLPRPVLALAIAALLASWSSLTMPPAAPLPGAFAGRLAAAADAVRAAEALGLLPKEAIGEMAAKLAGLAQNALPDDPAQWRELDAVMGQLAREELLAKLGPMVAGGERGERGGVSAADRTALAGKALEAMRALAKDDKLPFVARALVGQALAAVGNDVEQLLRDPDRLRQLAERFGGVAEMLGRGAERFGLDGLEGAVAGLDPKTIQRTLQSLLGGGGGGGGEAGGGRSPTGNRPKPKWLGPPVPGDTAREFVLPAGQPVPDQWQPVADGVVVPTTAPLRGEAVGGVTPSGRGGASWQLQLAPRHRAVVQKFFAESAAKDKR